MSKVLSWLSIGNMMVEMVVILGLCLEKKYQMVRFCQESRYPCFEDMLIILLMLLAIHIVRNQLFLEKKKAIFTQLKLRRLVLNT